MGKRSNPGSRIQMSGINGLSDHMLKVEIHPPKKPKIAIPDIALDGSMLSPTLSEESFEQELNRARKEFQQFTNDLDKISKRVEKLAENAPEWFADIEEIKIKQDNVEECITATQEKIIENEQRLEQLTTLQEEFNEDINKDLKKIQEQLAELLERHREARSTASMIAQNQSMTTEELDLMLEAIRDYARLIEDASSTIKHFDDIGSPLKYESLDLSPFRTYQGNISYFDDIYYATSTNGSYPSSPIRAPSPISPLMLPTQSTPPMSDDESSDLSSPSTPIDISQQPIYPSPYHLLRHQQLLLLGMRRAAVGLKFLLYAKRLNELEKKHPNIDYDSDWFLGMREDGLESYDSNKDIDACSSQSESESKAYGGIRKKSLVLHSYDLLRFDKRTIVK